MLPAQSAPYSRSSPSLQFSSSAQKSLRLSARRSALIPRQRVFLRTSPCHPVQVTLHAYLTKCSQLPASHRPLQLSCRSVRTEQRGVTHEVISGDAGQCNGPRFTSSLAPIQRTEYVARMHRVQLCIDEVCPIAGFALAFVAVVQLSTYHRQAQCHQEGTRTIGDAHQSNGVHLTSSLASSVEEILLDAPLTLMLYLESSRAHPLPKQT